MRVCTPVDFFSNQKHFSFFLIANLSYIYLQYGHIWYQNDGNEIFYQMISFNIVGPIPKEFIGVPMLMDKTRQKNVMRLRCHSSTGQIVPFPNGTGHKRASSILGLQCSQLELLVMPSSLAEACFG